MTLRVASYVNLKDGVSSTKVEIIDLLPAEVLYALGISFWLPGNIFIPQQSWSMNYSGSFW